jgi:hypothetical protein
VLARDGSPHDRQQRGTIWQALLLAVFVVDKLNTMPQEGFFMSACSPPAQLGLALLLTLSQNSKSRLQPMLCQSLPGPVPVLASRFRKSFLPGPIEPSFGFCSTSFHAS